MPSKDQFIAMRLIRQVQRNLKFATHSNFLQMNSVPLKITYSMRFLSKLIKSTRVIEEDTLSGT